MNNDITIIYYTSNHAPEKFLDKTKETLLEASNGIPIISVSQKPIDFGENICIGDIGRSHLNIYRQALIGAKAAKTKYIAMAEDDVLYTKEHFQYTPKDDVFLYNMNVWRLYTWVKPPIYSWKDRFNFHDLICSRELFIEAIEERFNKWPDDSKINIANWAEPGKYEGPHHLNVTERKVEKHYSKLPNIAFSHETNLQFNNLGTRKKLGPLQAYEIPFWGHANNIIKIYNEK